MSQPTILVVDDNAEIVTLVTILLNRAGYTVLSAADGPAALALAAQRVPQLILMDLTLPGLSGCTATQILKANKATAHIPIVAFTSHCWLSAQQLQDAGFNDVIFKPFHIDQLLEQVATWLEKSYAVGEKHLTCVCPRP